MFTVLAMIGIAYLIVGAIVGVWAGRRTPRDAPLTPLVIFTGTMSLWPWAVHVIRAELREARQEETA